MKKKKLKNMSIEEVSLVDRPANKRKFLLIKREDEITELTIKTDGTFDGTTLTVNGEKVKDLKAFWFMLWPPDDFDDGMVSGSYTVTETDGAEFDRETTFNLKKGMNTMKLEELLKALKRDPKSLSDEETANIGSLLKYVDMMPPADGEATLEIIKASLVKEEAPADEETPADKPAEDERDPEEVARIKAAMSVLNDTLPESERSVLKTAEPDKMDLILAILEKQGDKPKVIPVDDIPGGGRFPRADADDTPVTTAELLKRLIKVEETTGTSKEEDDTEGGDVVNPDVPLTKEERIKKYGTAYPNAKVRWGQILLQNS